MKDTLKPYFTLSVVQGSPEWKAERLRYPVTASAVPILLGLSKYQTIDDYVQEKIWGKEKERNEFAVQIMQRGHDVEPIVRAEVERKLGYALPPAVAVAYDCPQMLASLDGFNEDHGVIIEAKLVGKRVLQDIRKGKLKPDHECQVQAQLLATKARFCVYAAADLEGNFESLKVEPKPAYMENIKIKTAQFARSLEQFKELLNEIKTRKD